MSVIFPLLLVVIILACLGSLYWEGMWGNAINLINVILAGLLAFNFFEPLAKGLEDLIPSMVFLCDFLAVWIVFCVSLVILRLVTNRVSRVKVRFLSIADRIGSGVFAVLVGWVLVCFTTATLHTAPLARKFLWEGFNPAEKMMWGLAPDRQWLGLLRMVSAGSLTRGETHEFDANTQFILKYDAYRGAVEKVAASGSVFVKEGGAGVPSRSGGGGGGQAGGGEE